MATFNIEVEIPNEVASNFEELHAFQKHIVYQVRHYNEYASLETVYGDEIGINKFEKKDDDLALAEEFEMRRE